MKKIKLTQGKFALVDDEDYEYLNQWGWYAYTTEWNTYARRNARKGEAKPRSLIHLHRVIMKCPKDLVVDHINGNGLDNRKKNLRICTQAFNSLNRTKIQRNNTSGYTGVCYSKAINRWLVQGTRKDGHIGCFKTKKEAIKVREKYIRNLMKKSL